MARSPLPVPGLPVGRPFGGRPDGASHARAAYTPRGRRRFAERYPIVVRNPRPLGTNGYSTSWGTNSHGELSACPPGRR
ncbi:hypothetical protein SUDANB121_00801 [Nocardiopsis dassonvillei]|uniref:hypothetical protein n=1 Tax=Nocardiopsis dassonvillei TaxID=2014 RepID=UPI003F54962F